MPVSIEVTDQLRRTISLSAPPQRIISLVPSQTELLYDLGLEERVVGITKFCVHPKEWHGQKTRVGGTKNVHLDRVLTLNPNFVIANKEENVRDQIEQIARQVPVYISDVADLPSAISMIRDVGHLTQTEAAANNIIHQIETGFASLQKSQPIPTAYLIWKDPWMTIGKDVFINDMLDRCGFRNVFAAQERYPVTTLDAIRSSGCQLLLLSTEPYPFRQKHIDELSSGLPGVQILLVDGEYFSWYGSRLIKAPAYFRDLQATIRTMQ